MKNEQIIPKKNCSLYCSKKKLDVSFITLWRRTKLFYVKNSFEKLVELSLFERNQS